MGKNKTSFKKGKSGNPKGRPTGSSLKELNEAIEEARKANNKSIIEHFVERAYKSDKVLVALMKKLLADKISSFVEAEFDFKEPLVIKIIKKNK